MRKKDISKILGTLISCGLPKEKQMRKDETLPAYLERTYLGDYDLENNK